MSKGKVLIVDDQLGIRVLLNEVFQLEGYQTFQAANGPKAIELAKAHNPDIVLLDIKIPGMDGLEILKKLKNYNPSIQVIIMTAYSEQDLINEALENGALTYFAKPFDINEVKETVKNYINIESLS